MSQKIDVTSKKMPEELKTKLEGLTPFARAYAQYRAKGLNQPDSAKRAGSKAKDRGALGRVGWNTEQLDGVKEYILWLEHKRAQEAVIDDLELINGFRDIYQQALLDGKYADANKAMEHMGNMIGAFAYKNVANATKLENEGKGKREDGPKNNTNAFTQDLDDHDLGERAAKLHRLMEAAKTEQKEN